MYRTPPQAEADHEGDQQEVAADLAPEIEATETVHNHPTGKLGAVTRYKNLILELLPSFENNVEEIRDLYKIYMNKVRKFVLCLCIG